MKGGYGYYEEGEFETAIAAAAFSVKSLDDLIPNPYSSDYKNKKKYKPYGGDQIPISKSNTRKVQDSNYMPPQSHGSISKRSSPNNVFHAGQDTRVDAWERSAMAKIGKRYEKLNSAIASWEKEKRLKAKLEMDKKKRKLELKRELNLQHYENKIARINRIAEGARMQIEEKRKNEESEVRERKKRKRSRGKVPFSWLCFSC